MNPVKFLLSAILTAAFAGGLAYGGYMAVVNIENDAAARDAVWDAQGAWDATPVPAVPTDPDASQAPLGGSIPLPSVPPPPHVLEHGFAIVPNGYFGDTATVTYFPVSGSSADEVGASIRAQSPSTFTGGTAFAWVVPTANAAVSSSSGTNFFGQATSGCQVDPGQEDAIKMSYVVHLPLWEPPVNADPELVEWWNTEFSVTLAHERHHIDLYEFVVGRMNSTIAAGGDCESIKVQIMAAWDEAILHNCQYDLEDYGLASGSTLEDCTGQGVTIGPKLIELVGS